MPITTEQLVFLKDKIEKMTKTQQLDVLRILKKNSAIKLNENKSGIFVNISFLPKESIEEIDKYVKYVGDQESELNLLENQKQEFKNTFFSGMAIGAIEWFETNIERLVVYVTRSDTFWLVILFYLVNVYVCCGSIFKI